MIFEATRKAMKKLGLPEGDAFDMPSSTKRFPDGAAYRIECPTVNSSETVAALLETADKTGVTINRITETYGIFRHTAQEVKEYCKLCYDYGCELLLSTGPARPMIRAQRFFLPRVSALDIAFVARNSSSVLSRTSSVDMSLAAAAS